MICKYHLCNKLVTGRRRVFCSDKCKNKTAVLARRRRLKIMAVEYMGGCCFNCGYNRCLAALDFHHRHNKSFGISKYGHTRSWDRIKQELAKCVLLCRNCHNELHAGLFSI